MSEKIDRRRASWIDEHHRFLEANAEGMSYTALATLFNQEFGTNIADTTISRLCRNFGFTNGRPNRRPYTDEELEFLRRNALGVNYATLATMFTEQFGIYTTTKRIGDICCQKGFHNGINSRFQQGHSVNMGRKQVDSAPNGSETVDARGYVLLKHNGKWYYKHVMLWEQAHGQSVPEGHCITFGDGNKHNFSIENLYCLTASQNAVRIRNGLQGATPELAAAGVAAAKLYSQIGKRITLLREQHKTHLRLELGIAEGQTVTAIHFDLSGRRELLRGRDYMLTIRMLPLHPKIQVIFFLSTKDVILEPYWHFTL